MLYSFRYAASAAVPIPPTPPIAPIAPPAPTPIPPSSNSLVPNPHPHPHPTLPLPLPPEAAAGRTQPPPIPPRRALAPTVPATGNKGDVGDTTSPPAPAPYTPPHCSRSRLGRPRLTPSPTPSPRWRSYYYCPQGPNPRLRFALADDCEPDEEWRPPPPGGAQLSTNGRAELGILQVRVV
ncbi:hypothetical protein B0H14DRAFT_3453156 [Mycena olivaceomarginata]|nr:hypothetical protein B0H14DRAFT_3453156 [Mycena olivaceomarginata]